MDYDSEQLKLAHKRLFATLLTDPAKKAKVLELLTQEGLVSNVENMTPNSPLKRTKHNSPLKKLHEMMSPKPRTKTKIESPSALGRRRALQRLESDSSLDEPQDQTTVSRPSNAPELPYDEILKDLIVYCEVRSNGEDRSSSIKTMVRALGATVRDKITRDVTHVIFKDGLYSTFRKAQNMKMHIVSVLWLDAVRRYKCKMPAAKYKPLDFDKYNNMNQSQVCQEIEEEFNDVLTDEIRRSAVKKNKFESHFTKSTEIQRKISSESFSNTDLQNDFNRNELITPELSKNESNISNNEIVNPNKNKDLEFVPCSQNDSHSFTHKRKSTNLSKVVEETSISPSIITKHVRDSLELKNAQKLKSPENILQKSIESKRSSLTKISANDEESIRLHITTTTDQSLNNSSRKRSSSNFAQNLISNESVTKPSLEKDLNHVLVATSKSTDSLNGPINGKIKKNGRRTTIGLSRSRKSSVSNEIINEKTTNLINNVDDLLNNEQTENTSTIKKPKARKLFKGDHVDESLFDWNKQNEFPQIEKCVTPPKKRKVVLPADFPKNVSSKARRKVSTIKKSTSKKQNENTTVEPSKEKLAKILDFGEKSDSELGNKSPSPENNCPEPKDNTQESEIIKPKRPKRKSINPVNYNEKIINSVEDIKNKKTKRHSITPINYKSTTDESDDNDTEIIKPTTKIDGRFKRKSVVPINNNLDKTDDSYKTATSELPTLEKPRRKSSRIKIISASSSNSDDDDDNNQSQITNQTPARNTRQSSVIKNTPTFKNKSPKTPNLRKKIISNTPQTLLKTPNRRSTLEFLPRSSRKSLAKIKESQEPKHVPVKMSSIVCTRFHRTDTQVFAQIVKKLGGFFVEDEVSKRTTHLVCGGPSRTINLLRAIVRGCWILRKEWLFKSLEAGTWLEEEDYEMTEFSPAVQKCRLEKQSFGSLYAMDLFKNCGQIFISRGSNPRCSDLEELVQLCGGRIVRIVRDADIIVGEKIRNDNNNSISVIEKWILDSITDNKKKSFKNYEIHDHHGS